MNMKHPYKTRAGGATVTVFVPYDCKNHCPFCINKEEYADLSGFSLEKICRSIRRMDAITPYCDFVFTGGEPFSDIVSLQVMLDQIPTTHRVFINTTLPVWECQSDEDILAFAEKNRRKITCINVSRHMQKFVVESNDDLLSRLPVPFRVNCVLYKNYPAGEIVPYLERFRKIPGASIQFRFDYTATTPENLYDETHDRILRDLKKIAPYTGLDGCRMRCGFHFNYRAWSLPITRRCPIPPSWSGTPETASPTTFSMTSSSSRTGTFTPTGPASRWMWRPMSASCLNPMISAGWNRCR